MQINVTTARGFSNGRRAAVRRPEGPPARPESISQYVHKQITKNDDLRHELGLPANFSLHRLRHTHATLLLAAGVPVSVVDGRLGHSSPVVTKTVYAHFLSSADMLAADMWSGIIHDHL